MTLLLGQRHHGAAIDLDGYIVNEGSPDAKRRGSILVQSRAERIGRARQRHGGEKDGSNEQQAPGQGP
jgi:hypothetical protein